MKLTMLISVLLLIVSSPLCLYSFLSFVNAKAFVAAFAKVCTKVHLRSTNFAAGFYGAVFGLVLC